MGQKGKICLIGVGNILRCDDGIGAYICNQIEHLGLAGVDCLIVQQLQVELVEDILDYQLVIIADASLSDSEVDLSPLNQFEAGLASSHQIDAGMLFSVAKNIYQKELNIYICAVKGNDFSIGDTIKTAALASANTSVELIRNFIASASY